MQNRAPLKQELEEVIALWNQHKDPKQTLAALEKKRTIRWHHLGLAIATQNQDYDRDVMRSYLELLTTLASDTKTPMPRLIDHLTASSPNNHVDLPIILIIERRDATNTQHYIQLLQTIANHRDIDANHMANLITRRFKYNIGSDEQPVYDSSNILMEIACQLDKETLCNFLQLICALAACNKIATHSFEQMLTTPISYPQNIGEIINAKLDDPKAMLLLTDALSKLKISNATDHLPTQVCTDELLSEIHSRSISERESLYPLAMSADQPLHYLLRNEQEEVKRRFALTRQEKLLETIEQMPPQEQIKACDDALNPKTFLGEVAHAVDSDIMCEKITQLREQAQITDIDGSKLLHDIFSAGDCEGEVISFTNTQTGLFQPASNHSEELNHAIQNDAKAQPEEDDEAYNQLLGANR